jgi:sugar lactone lactonase YvrE
MTMRGASLILVLVVCAALLPAAAKVGTITTVAGGGPNNTPATDANVCIPITPISDAQGNLYISAGCRVVFRVDHATGSLTIMAGFAEANGADTGDGGPAFSASLSAPVGLALDANQNLFIMTGGLIRRVDRSTNVITTIAGSGGGCPAQTDSMGDGCPAINATFQSQGIAFDSSGNLFLADTLNERVRRIDATTSIVTTVAGGGSGCVGQTDSLGDGCPATSATLASPTAVAVDATGNLWVTDPNNNRVRKVASSTQVITTFAGGGAGCSGQTDPYGDGCPATSASFNSPLGVAVDGAGNVLVADYYNQRIRRIDAVSNIITTVAGGGNGCPAETDTAGDGCPATSASFNGPRTVTVSNTADILIADVFDFRVRSVNAGSAVITTVAGNGWEGFSGDNGPATTASLFWPWATALDNDGALLIADFDNQRIRRVDPETKAITTIAGGGQGCPAQTDSLGDGCVATSGVLSVSPGMFRDSAGNLLIADLLNNRVRRVDAVTQVITTIAGGGAGCPAQTDAFGDGCPASSALLNGPWAVAMDNAGNILLSDASNNLIRRIDANTQIITAVAGGGSGCPGQTDTVGDGCPATSASFNAPLGLAVDHWGNYFIVDTLNERVRRVDNVTGLIATVVGNGTRGFAGDYGLATSAELDYPAGVFVDAGDNLIVADQENNRVRLVIAATGIISTIAGNGREYFTGDGGKATSSGLDQPVNVLLDRKGNLFISDSGNFRIRKMLLARTATTTTVTTSGSPSHVGQPVTFTATVKATSGTIPNTEFVTFYDGKHVLGSVPISSGSAGLTTSSLSKKTHTIKVVYDGGAIFKGSQGHLVQVVVP